MLGKEYHAVVRPTQKPAQRKYSVDHQVLPLRPILGHRCSSRLRTRNRRFALPRLYDDITQREADGLSIWSNCDGSHGIHHARAGWLYLLADGLQTKPLPYTDIPASGGCEHGLLEQRTRATRLLDTDRHGTSGGGWIPGSRGSSAADCGGRGCARLITSSECSRRRPIRNARRRYADVPPGPLHRMVAVRNIVSHFPQPGIMHSALRGYLLPTRPHTARHREIHSGNQHHGAAARRKHEHALGVLSAVGPRRCRALRRFVFWCWLCFQRRAGYGYARLRCGRADRGLDTGRVDCRILDVPGLALD